MIKYIFVLINFISGIAFSQDNQRSVFSKMLSTKVMVELNSIRFDSSKSFTGIYSFRFRLSSDSIMSVYEGSKGMPLKVFDAIKKSVKTVCSNVTLETLLANEFYLIPVLFDYRNSPEDEISILDNSFYSFDVFENSHDSQSSRYILLKPIFFETFFHDGSRKFRNMFKKAIKN